MQHAGEAVLPGPDAGPDGVLLDERLIEAVFLAQELDLRYRVRILLHAADQNGQIIARRQLDDDEHQDADREKGRDHHQHPVNEIGEHRPARPRSFLSRQLPSNQKVSGR